MDWDPLRFQVEEVIRLSEARAVADLMRAGDLVRLGQYVDYFVEPSEPARGVVRPARHSALEKPYRVAVEQWHLDAAERMLQRDRADS
jgi:purine nucleoside phosphorylase